MLFDGTIDATSRPACRQEEHDAAVAAVLDGPAAELLERIKGLRRAFLATQGVVV